MSSDELRDQKRDAEGKATLPVSEDKLMSARARLWE